MKLLLAVIIVLCAPRALEATKAGHCRRGASYEDAGRVLDERELALLQDDFEEESLRRSQDADAAAGKYAYTAWIKKNKPSLLRHLGSEHPVGVEGGKVCLMFIPVGDNCKPALGIVSERDVLRLHKLGSQFVPLKNTLNNHAFMVECINKVTWLKWMKLEF